MSWVITGQMAGHIYYYRRNQHGAAQGAEATHLNFPCMCSFCKEPEHVLLYFGSTVRRCQDKLLLKVYVKCTESKTSWEMISLREACRAVRSTHSA